MRKIAHKEGDIYVGEDEDYEYFEGDELGDEDDYEDYDVLGEYDDDEDYEYFEGDDEDVYEVYGNDDEYEVYGDDEDYEVYDGDELGRVRRFMRRRSPRRRTGRSRRIGRTRKRRFPRQRYLRRGKPKKVMTAPPSGTIYRKGYPKYKGYFKKPPVEKEVGHKTLLTVTDNELASGALSSNTANTFTPVFQYTIPQGQRYHFKPDKIDKMDRNVSPMLFKIYQSSSPSNFLTGDFILKVKTSDGVEDKAVVISSNLAIMGTGTTLSADLTDIRKRVTADNDVWANAGDKIVLEIKATAALSTSASQIFMGATRYNV